MNIPDLECLGSYKVADASKTDVEPTFNAFFLFSCCVKLKQNSLNWKWALLLNTVFSLIWKMIFVSWNVVWAGRCVRVRVAEYFLYVCRQPYCPVWGWGYLPAGLQYQHRGPRRALRKQEPVQITLRAPSFFSCIVCKTMKLLELAEKLIILQWCVEPQLLAQPQSQTRATLTAHLQQLSMFFFSSPVLFFLYRIYLKKAIKTTNNSDNNHNCT